MKALYQALDFAGHSQNKENAFIAIYNEYYSRVYHFANRYVDNSEEAKDIIHNSFLKLWEAKSNISEIQDVEDYLYKIVQNACIDFHRKSTVRSKAHADLLYQLKQNHPKDNFKLDQIRAEVMELASLRVEKMPEKYQRVYVMSFLNGMKNEEVANELCISNQLVRNIKSHILKAIRISWEERDLAFLVMVIIGTI